MTRISVLVPVYNTSQYLRECLDSIIQQTFTDIEIICVDDCSTDNSQEILQEYAKKDNRIKIYKNDVNVGSSITRNILFSKATSPFIMWCDSDDYYMPNMCSTMYFHINDQNVDMVDCGIYYEKGGGIIPEQPHGKLMLQNTNKNYYSIIHSRSMCNKIYKKEIIDNYNIQCPNTRTTEDVPFNIMYIMVAQSIYHCGDVLYFYRYNSNSQTSSYGSNKTNQLKNLYNMNLYDNHFAFVPHILKFAKEHNLLQNNYDKLGQLIIQLAFFFFTRGKTDYKDALIKINIILSQFNYTNANISVSEKRLLKMIINNESKKIKNKFHPNWLKRNIKIKLSLRNKEFYIKLGKLKLSLIYN